MRQGHQNLVENKIELSRNLNSGIGLELCFFNLKRSDRSGKKHNILMPKETGKIMEEAWEPACTVCFSEISNLIKGIKKFENYLSTAFIPILSQAN